MFVQLMEEFNEYTDKYLFLIIIWITYGVNNTIKVSNGVINLIISGSKRVKALS